MSSRILLFHNERTNIQVIPVHPKNGTIPFIEKPLYLIPQAIIDV